MPSKNKGKGGKKADAKVADAATAPKAESSAEPKKAEQPKKGGKNDKEQKLDAATLKVRRLASLQSSSIGFPTFDCSV